MEHLSTERSVIIASYRYSLMIILPNIYNGYDFDVYIQKTKYLVNFSNTV